MTTNYYYYFNKLNVKDTFNKYYYKVWGLGLLNNDFVINPKGAIIVIDVIPSKVIMD